MIKIIFYGLTSNDRDDFYKCNYFLKLYNLLRFHPWRHGYPADIRHQDCDLRRLTDRKNTKKFILSSFMGKMDSRTVGVRPTFPVIVIVIFISTYNNTICRAKFWSLIHFKFWRCQSHGTLFQGDGSLMRMTEFFVQVFLVTIWSNISFL